MFNIAKRQQREKQESAGAHIRLTDAVLKSSTQGLFLLDAKDRVHPQVSSSLAKLFRRQDFGNLSFEKLIGPIVSSKTLTAARTQVARILDGTAKTDGTEPNPLQDVEVRLVNPDGSAEVAHYSFEFTPADEQGGTLVWLVRVSDISVRVQQGRELEDLRMQVQTQRDVLRGVLHAGAEPFAAFLQKTDASMKTINGVLKKPAREADAFRSKLEETLQEVDRVRRDAAGFKLAGLEAAARQLEDSLLDLRGRSTLSGSDFLPLAVKLDHLFGEFSLIRSVSAQAAPAKDSDSLALSARMTDNGTQVIEAPAFLAGPAQTGLAQTEPVQSEPAAKSASKGLKRIAQAGSLGSTLTALTELVAQQHGKNVVLASSGLENVPPKYQAAVKNVAIQLIRNAILHGIETPEARTSAGKPLYGTLHLEFKEIPDQAFELLFQDDGCGLDPVKVRATAIARGILDQETAVRLRDRQVIKLIFKSAFTTLESAPGEPKHGSGMALIRRYVHDAGGKIAIASLTGHDTRFKITLPAVAADARVA